MDMISREEIDKNIFDFLLELYDTPKITRSAVQLIIQRVEELIEKYTSLLEKIAQEKMKNYCPTDVCGALHIKFEEFKYPLKPYFSEHLRIKICLAKEYFIEPEQFEIGKELVDIVSKDNNIITKEINRYAVFIPLKPALKMLLETPKMFHLIQEYVQELNNEEMIISNFMQGSLWKQKYRNENKCILPFFLFADDFETGNALGSHAGKQKIIGLYVSFPFLPPYLAKKKENIVPVTLFYSEYRKAFGNKAVFKKIIDECNDLSQNGLEIKIENKTYIIYFQLTLITGDNEGLNSICGFVESFKAHRFCRICRATLDNCQGECDIDIKLLRNKKNYDEDVKSKCISTGIKEENCFHEFINYHVTTYKTNDLMHDLNERVIGFTIGNVLTKLIEENKLITLEISNERIKNFNYGEWEKNKLQ